MGVLGHKLSLEGFVEWENALPVRNEFNWGEVVPVADVGRVHGCVVSNLLRHLGNELQRSPCQVFSQSLTLQIADDTILYPDVFLTCDRATTCAPSRSSVRPPW